MAVTDGKIDKIEKIEKLTREIEGASFDKAIAKFTEAAGLIKQALAEGEKQKGKVLEIIREIDEIVEREMVEED